MADNTPDSPACGLQEPYALQVLGDEMAPEFPDRSIVIIAPTDRCQPGAYVFAEVDGVRWLRRYVHDARGAEFLIAENPQYPAIPLAGLDWRVLGVVTQRNIRRRVKHYP